MNGGRRRFRCRRCRFRGTRWDAKFRGHFRPTRELANSDEIRVPCDIDPDAEVREPLDHHDGVVRATAQRLRSRQQIHQIGIVLATRLKGPPGEVVKRFEVVAGCSGFRLRTAVGDVRAGWSSRVLKEKSEGKKERHGSRKPLV